MKEFKINSALFRLNFFYRIDPSVLLALSQSVAKSSLRSFKASFFNCSLHSLRIIKSKLHVQNLYYNCIFLFVSVQQLNELGILIFLQTISQSQRDFLTFSFSMSRFNVEEKQIFELLLPHTKNKLRDVIYGRPLNSCEIILVT